MQTLRKTILAFLSLALVIGPNSAYAVSAIADPVVQSNIQKQIQDQAKQLEVLNQAIKETQGNLTEVQQQKNTLQQQVKTLDVSINQLNLNIQSDAISAKKVSYEIDSINIDLGTIRKAVGDKVVSISDLFRELQRSQDKSTLQLFLENKTLAEGIAATQGLEDVRSQLSADIQSLKDLQQEYQGKLGDLSGKKDELLSDQQNLANRKQIVQDTKQERATLLAQTKDKESVYQKQISDLQKQQEDIANQIEALDAVLRSKVDPKFLPSTSSGVLGLPIQGTMPSQTKGCNLQNCTQGYGATTFAKYGYRGKWHNGIDFGIPIGTPVFAAEDGTVLYSANEDAYCPRGAYGKFVEIKHNNGLTTLYGHLSKYIVSAGQAVKRGQVIGYSGKTGYATGAHLHFTVFATATIPPATGGKTAEGITWSKSCGPLPIGGDLNPLGYL